jgi:hypothetical protein
MAGSLDLPFVEEGLTRTVRQRDEAEALLGIEPFDAGLCLALRRYPGALVDATSFQRMAIAERNRPMIPRVEYRIDVGDHGECCRGP